MLNPTDKQVIQARDGQILDLRRRVSGIKARRLPMFKTVFQGIGFVTVLAAAGIGIYAGWMYIHRPLNLNNVQVVERLVSRLYILPSGEQPTLATVTDKAKLQTAFLQQANNGDKVLIYEKTGVAIIYRPKLNRIVAVGPVSIQPISTSASGAGP